MKKYPTWTRLLVAGSVGALVLILVGGVVSPHLRQGWLARHVHNWAEAVATLAGCYQCGANYLSFDSNGNLYVTSNGSVAQNTMIPTGSSTWTVTTADTSCHNVTAAHFVSLINESSSAQPNAITIYLNESSALCTSTVSYPAVLGASQAILPCGTLGCPITSGTGFSYKQSTAGVTTIMMLSSTI